MYKKEDEERRESVSMPGNQAYLPVKVNYWSILPIVLRANIGGIALWVLKWLSLAALAISLVLGFTVVSNKNRCDRLLRFFRGDTTLEWETPNDPAERRTAVGT